MLNTSFIALGPHKSTAYKIQQYYTTNYFCSSYKMFDLIDASYRIYINVLILE